MLSNSSVIFRRSFLFFGFFVSSAENEECEELDLNTIEEIALDETRGGTYLSLDELGVFLSLLASSGIYILLIFLSV